MEEVDVALDVYGVQERIGPHMEWADGTPLYNEAGEFLPSPELRALGKTPADFAFYPRWQPHAFINADLLGVDTHERPSPELNPGVLLEAAQPRSVLTKHYARAIALEAAGVEFTHHTAADVEAVNKLIGNLTVPLARDDNGRGVVIARHPSAGIIGAVVIEATELAGQVTFFATAVAVVTQWRGRGLGSVLLKATEQLLPARPMFAAGRCSVDVAPFFAQAGFTVLRSGSPLPFPSGDVVDAGERCWFYRQGRI